MQNFDVLFVVILDNQPVEQTVKLSVIGHTMTLMWCDNNVYYEHGFVSCSAWSLRHLAVQYMEKYGW